MPKIKRALHAVAIVMLAGVLPGIPTSLAAGAEPKPAYVDLTGDFVRFFDETTGMEEQPRVALLRKQLDPLLPGFYTPRNETDPARYDTRVAGALKAFPLARKQFEKVQKDFATSFEMGIQHFRKDFPGFTPTVLVYLVHSLGEMDGGTRTLGDQTYLIFGADVIARIHEPRTITPFLDHELFHVEHRKHFETCDEVWCALWAEGLATYAAKVMNPGADDAQLLLMMPKPIRANVEATWPAAACFARSRLSSMADEDARALFYGGPDNGPFPRRFGYYIGLRAVEELDGKYSLPELAKMPADRAKVVLTAAIEQMIEKAGGCKE